jgi:hypothetical protein
METPKRSKRKTKGHKGKRASPADPNERLKPMSLHPLRFEEVIDIIVKAGKRPRA